MKAYSQDVRERVLRAVDQGYPKAEIVQLFGISRCTGYLGHPFRKLACSAHLSELS
jgi:transposase